MGNTHSNQQTFPGFQSKNNNHTHYEGYGGDCGTLGDVLKAGAAEARLEDHDSPGPIGDAINNIIDGVSNTKWSVAPSQLTGKTHDSNNCPNNPPK